MEDLPKLTDGIYKEIEEFEDYEYSNCIAYEMAIRNKDVIKLLNVLTKIDNLRKSLNPKERINWKERRRVYYPVVENKFTFKILKKELKKKYFIDFNKKQRKNISRIVGDIAGTPILRYGAFNHSKEEKEFYRRSKSLDGNINKMGKNEIIKDGYYTIQTYYKKSNKYKNKFYSNFKKELYSPYRKSSIELNLNLPKEELISYISKIKDEYNKDNSIVKTPLELLNEDYQIDYKNDKDKTKTKKSLMSKKFFVYDYVTKRLEQIEESSKYYITEYEEDINRIKNDSFISSKYKTIQINEKRKELKKNTNSRIIEIFQEFKDLENIGEGKAKRYYYNIKPFIDDLKYKELI